MVRQKLAPSRNLPYCSPLVHWDDAITFQKNLTEQLQTVADTQTLTRRLFGSDAHALRDAKPCTLHATEQFTCSPAIQQVLNAPRNFVSLLTTTTGRASRTIPGNCHESAAQSGDLHISQHSSKLPSGPFAALLYTLKVQMAPGA